MLVSHIATEHKLTIMREFTGIFAPYAPLATSNNMSKSKLCLIENERGIQF